MLLYFGGHTYEVIETALNWTDAKNTAKSWGGKLVQIDSAAENAAVFKFLMNASKSWSDLYIAPDGGDAAYVWIGANDIAKEGTWKWSDGTSLKYTNWGYGGEPDDWQGQDAAAIGIEKWPYPNGGLGNAGQWNDIDVTNGLYALVEFDGLLGTKGNDTIVGGSLSEKFVGGAGNDTLKGAGGNDTMLGDAGTDRIYGGSGNDKLTGGIGRDHLYGETGGDIFIFTSTKDSTVASTGRDTIYDFTSADTIHLSAIDANTKVAGNQAFSFIGTKAFSGKAGELQFKKMSSDTYIYGDVNGDKKADFAIHLDDALTLTKADFIL